MAQQFINLGTPNGQDGDFVRTAWEKAQDNFTELYALQFFTDRIVSGSVSYISGLTFDVVISAYIKNGVLLPIVNPIVSDTVTLSVGDPINPRIDVIAVTEDEQIVVIEGTPAVDPAEPTINFDTQLKVTSVLVQANATTPDGVTTVRVYDDLLGEPTEWTATENTSGARIDLGSTNDPDLNNASVETTGLLIGDRVIFTNDASLTTTGLSAIRLRVKNKNTAPTQLQVRLLSGASLVNQNAVFITDGQFGFDNSNTSTYQTISISAADLGIQLPEFDTIQIGARGFNGSDVFIDDVSLTFGVINPNGNGQFLTLTDVVDNDYIGKNGYVPIVTNEQELTLTDFNSLLPAPDNLGNHIATQNLDMATFNIDFTNPDATVDMFQGKTDFEAIGDNFNQTGLRSVSGNNELFIGVTPFNNTFALQYYNSSSGDNSFLTRDRWIVQDVSEGINTLDLADTINGLQINSTNAASRGLFSTTYFGANYTDNTYVQKKYVDDSIGNYVPYTGATQAVDLNTQDLTNINTLESTTYNGMRLNVGSVNRVSLAGAVITSIGGVSVVSIQRLAAVNNTGSQVIAIGDEALRNNSGSRVLGLGDNAGDGNSNNDSIFLGDTAGQSNVGAGNLTLVGSAVGATNEGLDLHAYGYAAAQRNTGDNVTAIGDRAGLANEGDNNTFLGHGSGPYYSGPTIDVDFSEVDVALNRITETGHGFTIGEKIHLVYQGSSGLNIGGMTTNIPFIWEVIDANTLQVQGQNFSTQGTLTHTFLTQIRYDNATALGANSSPTQDNQVMLGDSNIESVRTANTSYIATDDQDFVTKKNIEQGQVGIVEMGYAASDELSDLEVGTSALTFRMPFSMTLTDVIITVNQGPFGSKISCDLNKDGTSVLSTNVTIDEETRATGTVDLTGGASGSVDSITVDGVEIMSGAEAFDTDLTTTATNVAANITAHSSAPNYTATAVGTLITIESVFAGDDNNGFVVVSSATTITTADTNLSGGTSGETSNTAAVPVVISDSSLPVNSEIAIDIDQVGSTQTGKGLKVWLIGTKA